MVTCAHVYRRRVRGTKNLHDLFIRWRRDLAPRLCRERHLATVTSARCGTMRLEAAHTILVQSSRGWPTNAAPHDWFSRADAFLDALADWSADDWLRLGAFRPVRADTLAILEATLAEQRLALDAWRVRDCVETLAFLASCSRSMLREEERQAMARARRAAESAALALLAQGVLPAAVLAELLSPFKLRPLARSARAQ